jgi:thermitase
MKTAPAHALVITALLVGLTSTPAAMAGLDLTLEWTWAPDELGGYASTHVIVRVAPDVTPAELSDGRVSFTHATRTPTHAATEAAIADALTDYRAAAVSPTASHDAQNVALAQSLGLDRYYKIHVPAGTDVLALVDTLNAFPSHIEIAELDPIGGVLATYPNDTHFGLQYGLHNTGQTINGSPGTADADIDAPEAWDLHTGTADIIVAIIDTGLSASHPEFNGKRVPGRNFNGGDPNDTDDSFFIPHGTHCSGILGATGNNAAGVSGVSWGCRIMPVKVLNWIGGGEETWCADGVIWAADNGAHVGSMSLGYPDGITYFENAINYAHGQGMVLVAATGNDGVLGIYPPARWANVIAVGATDNDDQVADFTSYGPEMSVSAPGVDVYSCYDSLFNPDTYDYMSGTSMACPHVAGLAALVWSANLDLTNDEVRAIIESTADDKGAAGWDQYFGYGRVNAYAAVDAALTPAFPTGDMNCDGTVSAADIDGFVLALTGGAAGYGAAYPDCVFLNADCNDDGQVTAADIDGFVAILTGNG